MEPTVGPIPIPLGAGIAGTNDVGRQHEPTAWPAEDDKGLTMGRVSGKVAVISGAARGQGRSHARLLAGEGADNIAVDVCADIQNHENPRARPEDLDETARLVEKEGQRAFPAIADVRDRAALAAAIDAGVAELGHLALVVANAG